MMKIPGTFKDEVLEPELEIVAILQDMALEAETEQSVEEEEPIFYNTAEIEALRARSKELERVVTETPVEAEPDYSMTEEEQMADVASQIIEAVTRPKEPTEQPLEAELEK